MKRTPETPAFQAYQMYYILEVFGAEALLDVLEGHPAVAPSGEMLQGHPGDRCEWAGSYRAVCDHEEVNHFDAEDLFPPCSRCANPDTIWVP
jgi:hypothetical protein